MISAEAHERRKITDTPYLIAYLAFGMTPDPINIRIGFDSYSHSI